MHKEKECYQAYRKELLQDLLQAEELMLLTNLLSLFDITNKKHLIDKRTIALLNQAKQIYDFKTRPFETLQNTSVLKALEHAITYRKVIKLRYRSEKGIMQTNFHPYRILFLNENFYLVGENISKHNFEFRRIAMIEEVSYKGDIFMQSSELAAFIETIQTPLANFSTSPKTVQLRISKKIRRFFHFKKYLPSQKILQTFDNGDILVQYEVTNFHEVEEMVIKWLPDIEIISPKNLKKMIKKKLRVKLESISI